LLRVLGDSAVCVGVTSTYSALGTGVGPYQWAVRGGQVVGPATGRTVQIRWASAGLGRATVSGVLAGGCLTDSVARLVAVGNGPAIMGPATYCPLAHTDIRYTIAGPPAPYRWAVATGTLLSGQGTNEVRIAIPQGATATIEVVNPATPACSTSLRVVPDQTCLGFFTIITPNGDHQNDVFFIENLTYHPQTALTIFNRWGRKIFYTTDYQNDYGGEETSAGLYYYLCQLADGTSYKGWFELVR
jgi:gliding motility-associated-like protein